MLSDRRLRVSAVAFTGILTAVVYISIHSDTFGICGNNDYGCMRSFMPFEIGEPLYWSSLSLFVIFLLLLFLSQSVFKFWARFAVPYVLVAAVIIASTPVYGNFSPGREQMTQMLGGLYVVLSLIVIAIAYFRTSRAKSTPPTA